MPPKATGRGRGRGRGGRVGGQTNTGSPDDSPAMAATSVPEVKLEDTQSETSFADTSQANPAYSNAEPMDIDNNALDSPASVPTETPAPTPRRGIEASEIPDAPTSSVALEAPVVLGEKQVKKSRFKPKIKRTDPKVLEARAAEEDEKRFKREKEAAKLAGIATRGMSFRGMRGRGRGDAMGRGRGGSSSAAGLFGVAPDSGKFNSFQ